MDRLTSAVIHVGGIAVIAAVLGILVYLGAVTVPLFRGAEVERDVAAPAPTASPVVLARVDEYRSILLTLGQDGVARAARLSDGAPIAEERVAPEGRRITAISTTPGRDDVALGFDDGSVLLGTIALRSRVIAADTAPPDAKDLPIGETLVLDGALVSHPARDQIRLTRLVVEAPEPETLSAGEGAIVALDAREGGGGELLLALRADGTALYERVRIITPLGGGEPRLRLQNYPMPFQPREGEGPPRWLFITADAASAIAVWEDGFLQRYATSNPDAIVLAETARLTPEGVRLTACRMLLGGLTLLAGDERGGVGAWFAARDPAAEAPDRLRWVMGHDLGVAGSPVTSFGLSSRDRLVVVGLADGRMTLRHVTSHKVVARLDAGFSSPIAHSMVAPKTDGLFAMSEQGETASWVMAPGHPEATLRSLFGKVWYEGAPAPGHVYQSTAGDDASEVKLNLTPLVFGTIKSTVYAMLFATPLAVLAAIFTSEFLHPRVRLTVKPVVEVMASLPSVVLGFVAALVIAPFAAEHLPAILLAFVVIPVAALLAGTLWQMIPVRVASRLTSSARLALSLVLVAAAFGVSIGAGPLLERALFRPSEADVLVLAGAYEPVPREQWPEWVGMNRQTMSPTDGRRLQAEGLYFREGQVVRPAGSLDDPAVRAAAERDHLDRASITQWLNGVIGRPFPGWVLIAFPLSMIAVAIARTSLVEPWLRDLQRGLTPAAAGVLELAKFAAALAASAALALLIAGALSAAGLDPRDSIIGAFTPRNSLVVGIAMGFAIIPLIYTICEDALSSVPESLRSASLGAGATRWQTAIRVIVPVAMSGIFSACMIGLGRAAGETMIVLMATGNTPDMDWNIFSGFRALSANIATELPEAGRDTTHYRVLFLCGLVLFALTFVINTFAEIVRQRFRKRSASL